MSGALMRPRVYASLRIGIVCYLAVGGWTLKPVEAAGIPLNHVSSIGDLRHQNPSDLHDQETLQVDFYAHPDDGGGGLFRWAKDDRAADDGGMVIAPDRSSETGRWRRVRLEPGVVSPLYYGARCNGRDDDAPAIYKAVAQIRRQRTTGDMEPHTGVLRLPAEQCTIRTTIDLTGLGSVSVMVEETGGNLVCAVAGDACIDAMNSARLGFRDVTIYGTRGDMPKIGLQLGRPSQSGSAAGMYLDHVSISGFFSLAAFYNLNAETQLAVKLNASNDANYGYGAIYDGLNHFAVRSRFTQITERIDYPESFNDNTCLNCRITSSGIGGTPLWISTTSELTFENSYISNFGNGVGAVLYAWNTNLNFDAHFEAVGLTHVFLLAGQGHPTIYGLRYREHDLFATQSIFGLDIGVDTATLENVEIDVGRNRGRGVWFDDPSRYTVSGRLSAISKDGWVEPSKGFSGTECFANKCTSN